MRLVSSLAAVACLAASGPAFAHAFLVVATPAVGSVLRQAPTRVVISYTETVEPDFSTIEVRNASGVRMNAGAVRTVPGDGKQLVVALTPLKPGTYEVVWHVTAMDTHKTEGAYRFTVGP